jgi:hypothetical protein
MSMSWFSSTLGSILDSAQTVACEEARAIYNALFAQHGVVGTINMVIGTTTRFGLEGGMFVHDAGFAAFLTAGQAALHAGQAAFNESILDARQVGMNRRLGPFLPAAPLQAAADALAQKAAEDAAAKKAEEAAAAAKAAVPALGRRGRVPSPPQEAPPQEAPASKRARTKRS